MNAAEISESIAEPIILFLVCGVEIKRHFIIPNKWIKEFTYAKHINNSLNKNQIFTMCYLDKTEVQLPDRAPNNKYQANFHAAGISIDAKISEDIFKGCLQKCFGM